MEIVHEIDQLEMKIDKLVKCEAKNSVISLCRGELGFWNLATGVLEQKVSECYQGGKFKLSHMHLLRDAVRKNSEKKKMPQILNWRNGEYIK